MPRVKGIFVSPSGLVNAIAGGIAKTNTSSQFAHAAVGFEDCIIEAAATEICISQIDKYDHEAVLVVVDVPVCSDQYKAGWRRANSLVGRPYKADDCDIRGAAAIFGKEFGEELAKCIAIDGTLNSSAVYTLVFRAMFPEFLQGQPLATITPQVAYEATVELLNI